MENEFKEIKCGKYEKISNLILKSVETIQRRLNREKKIIMMAQD